MPARTAIRAVAGIRFRYRSTRWVNSVAVGKDGTVYALSRVTEGQHPRTDLISIKGPFRNK